MMPQRQPPPGCEPGEVRVARKVFTELATQVALGVNTSETGLRTNFEFMRVLWKRDYLDEFNGRFTFVTVTHVDDLFQAYDTRCKTTKSLLEAIVREFNMSRKQDDFVFVADAFV